MEFLIAGYTIALIILGTYVASLVQRIRVARKEIEALEQEQKQ